MYYYSDPMKLMSRARCGSKNRGVGAWGGEQRCANLVTLRGEKRLDLLGGTWRGTWNAGNCPSWLGRRQGQDAAQSSHIGAQCTLAAGCEHVSAKAECLSDGASQGAPCSRRPKVRQDAESRSKNTHTHMPDDRPDEGDEGDWSDEGDEGAKSAKGAHDAEHEKGSRRTMRDSGTCMPHAAAADRSSFKSGSCRLLTRHATSAVISQPRAPD
ncbi:hypothetical protein CDD81_5288 [Ophiocordyceps australis]|uniref:Uncharacterized protein n=1 Tax=Ophiocordyceps australis TaxID=1399860 RepID=A0A2C5YGV1_9HYPO|nr:hypothetical protein CDD81_5288 [Ophiocordyceps australis]